MFDLHMVTYDVAFGLYVGLGSGWVGVAWMVGVKPELAELLFLVILCCAWWW